ncbi:MAG: hypothetical protein WA182_14795 [Candidatus Sulfotelmatobacter sp.]
MNATTEIKEIKEIWNSLTPAQRRERFVGASKASSYKRWDALGVMAQMLIIL